MKQRILFFILIISFTQFSFAQERRPPTDIELKAAYCAIVIKDRIELYNRLIDNPLLPTSAKNVLVKSRNSSMDQLDRIGSYILPRIPYIDLESILLAQNRAKIDTEVDNKPFTDCLDSCGNKNGFNKICTDKCTQGNENALRIQSCQNLSWLPF